MLLVLSVVSVSAYAETTDTTSEQTKDDPIYVFSSVLSEIVQIFLSMWRIVYVTFEVFALIFIFLIIPVLIFKTMKWGIKEVFGK